MSAEIELIGHGIARSQTSGLHYFSAAHVLRVLSRLRAAGSSVDNLANELVADGLRAESGNENSARMV
jgi:hypothetical protein